MKKDIYDFVEINNDYIILKQKGFFKKPFTLDYLDIIKTRMSDDLNMIHFLMKNGTVYHIRRNGVFLLFSLDQMLKSLK